MKPKIAEEMKRFKPLPKGYKTFADKLFKDFHFIAFKSKEETAYCTRCKNEFKRPRGYKHGGIAKCPCCHKELKLVNTNIRKYGQDSKPRWGVILNADNNDLLLQYVKTTVTYRKDYRERNVYCEEIVRGVVKKKTQKLYEYDEWTDDWRNYRDYKAMRPKTNNYAPVDSYLYPKDIDKVVKKTWAKYSGLAEFLKSMDKNKVRDEYFVPEFKYFWAYRQNPDLEKLAKLGMTHLTYACASRKGTVYEMLGVNRQQFKLLLDMVNPDENILALFRTIPNLKMEEYRAIYERMKFHYPYCNEFDFVAKMLQHTTVHKFVKYFETWGSMLYIYKDYIRFCEELGRNLDDEFVIYPKNLMQAHDTAYEMIQMQKAEEKRKELEQKEQECKEMLAKVRKLFGDNIKASNLNINNLFIRLPNNLMELTAEGDYLHHCVGSYANSVAEGKTQIYFIRKQEAPDTPYYTLEWKENRVAQCRGLRNCDMTPEVKEFVRAFEALMTVAEPLAMAC